MTPAWNRGGQRKTVQPMSDMSGTVVCDSRTASESSVDPHEKSRRCCDEEFLVIYPVNDLFCKALDCRTYQFAHKLSCYDEEVARSVTELAKRLQVQMNLLVFDSF